MTKLTYPQKPPRNSSRQDSQQNIGLFLRGVHYGGFAISELLVSVAAIAILISLAIPGLHAVQASSQQDQCLANLEQLTAAWAAFPTDHNQQLVKGLPDDDGWVRRGAGNDPIRDGQLYSYVNSMDPWNCPSDVHGSERSYSITAPMRGENWNLHELQPNHSTIQIGTDRLTDIINPRHQMVLLEDIDSRGWNVGSWLMYARTDYKFQWIDSMAMFHGNGTAMSFADGHVDYWQWEDQDTLYAGRNAQLYLNDMENPDWLRVRNSYRSLLSYPNVPELVAE